MRIAILEDDPHLSQLLQLWIEEPGHTVAAFDRGQALINTLRRESFDLLILDWMVPDLDGEQVLEWVRAHMDWPIPVIFVTQRDEEDDVVRILSKGADDYLVKPVRQRELLARVEALARRSHLQQPKNEHVLSHDPYALDIAAHTVSFRGETVQLTQKEFDLAEFLFRNSGRILSRDHILEHVWGHRAGLNTRTVDTHISRLRSKLHLSAENGWRLTGIYHHGYRLEPVENHPTQ